jgi:hypothetical protein
MSEGRFMTIFRNYVRRLLIALLILSTTCTVTAQSIATIKKQADKGDAKAQYDLGEAYYNGDGAPKDYTQAAFWYRKSADHGYARAQYNLGYLYYTGMGVSQDSVKAASLYREAAEQGVGWAQYGLANLYVTGEGVAQDYAEAYLWLELASSVKLVGLSPEDVTKLRDSVASHLTVAGLAQTQGRILDEKEKIAYKVAHSGGTIDLHIIEVRSIAPEKRVGFSRSLEVYAVDAYSTVSIGSWSSAPQTVYVLYCVKGAPEVGKTYVSHDENIESNYSFLHLWPVEKTTIGLNESGRLFRVVTMRDAFAGKIPDLACDVYSAKDAK